MLSMEASETNQTGQVARGGGLRWSSEARKMVCKTAAKPVGNNEGFRDVDGTPRNPLKKDNTKVFLEEGRTAIH